MNIGSSARILCLGHTGLLALVTLLGTASCEGSSSTSGDAAPASGSDGPTAVTDAGGASDGPSAAPDAGASTGCSSSAAPAVDLVITDRGPVRGAVSAGAAAFLGIPYAAPPVGSLRWRPPQPHACWSEVRSATSFGPACPQIPQQQGKPFDPAAPMIGDEDCLTVNVWTPADRAAGPTLPVLVFIHGGGNTIGSASERGGSGAYIYDGAKLAAGRRAVVVTVQYRLGALGFLAHAALDAESPERVSGNFGLRDLVSALGWVKRNAEAFGGDAKRLLVFGESAGAVNTCMLVGVPAAAGLFSRALVQSGSCASAPPLGDKRTEGAMFARAAGCDGAPDVAACLRALGSEQIVRAVPSPVSVGLAPTDLRWGPTVDGAVLPELPLDAIAGGRHNAVPMIVGSNLDETGLATGAIPTEEQYRASVTALFGPVLAPQILALYPASQHGSPRAAFVQVGTDAKFGCQARLSARAAAKSARAPIYRYVFAQPLESAGAALEALGAWHGVELAFLFQSFDQPAATAGEREVARSMQEAWVRFADTGTPGAVGGVAWPAYGAGEPLLRLEPRPAVVEGWRNAECDFWDAIARRTIPPPPAGPP